MKNYWREMSLFIMKINHYVQFHGLYIMEITRRDRFLWFVYNENEPLRALVSQRLSV